MLRADAAVRGADAEMLGADAAMLGADDQIRGAQYIKVGAEQRCSHRPLKSSTPA